MSPKKVDTNQPDIVRGLRQLGVSVAYTHTLGRGFPDVVAGHKGRSYLLEIKTGKDDLTADERAWHAGWKGDVYVVRSLEDAMAVMGIQGD